MSKSKFVPFPLCSHLCVPLRPPPTPPFFSFVLSVEHCQVYLAFIFDMQLAGVCVWSRGRTPAAVWLLHCHHFTSFLFQWQQLWQFTINSTGFQSSIFHTAATFTRAPIWRFRRAIKKPKCVGSRAVCFFWSLVVGLVCRSGLTD